MTTEVNPSAVADEICVERKTCRICGSSDLRTVVDLGAQYIASAFIAGEPPDFLRDPQPLEVVRCVSDDGCGLVQLRHSVAPRVLYHDYGYRSGTNEIMRKNLRSIVESVGALVDLQPGDTVLDIGCNDGTLLESYRAQGLDRVGIDPSTNVAEVARSKGFTVENDFFSRAAFERVRPGRKARVVTSIAMFYDLEDPTQFVADVASVLADDGIWVIELSYLPFMLERKSFDTICHEHLEYYALRQIEWMVERQGLQIQRIELNDINGGSFRLLIRNRKMGALPAEQVKELEEFRNREAAMKLATEAPYEEFRRAAQTVQKDLRDVVRSINDEGKIIYAYGASTKGNTILQYCGLDNLSIKKAADRNPDKWGRHTLGTNIPIVSEEQARQEKPDYFLVLPWHFFDGFIAREREFLDRGGKFILPLPETKIVGRDDL
jgi:NDP-4-keto-2,6-dideoxyhexose 3-C-methyltransferase